MPSPTGQKSPNLTTSTVSRSIREEWSSQAPVRRPGPAAYLPPYSTWDPQRTATLSRAQSRALDASQRSSYTAAELSMSLTASSAASGLSAASAASRDKSPHRSPQEPWTDMVVTAPYSTLTSEYGHHFRDPRQRVNAFPFAVGVRSEVLAKLDYGTRPPPAMKK